MGYAPGSARNCRVHAERRLRPVEQDKILRYAVERQLIVIGEAAAHVSGGYQDQHPEIPWVQIIGQRNILAHEYGEILVERIWLTATRSLPELLKNLESLVPEK